MSPIRTCVLGAGLSGLTFQIPFILALPELFTLHAVFDLYPDTARERVAKRFGISPKIYATLEDVLADREIELVIVSTPNGTHYEYTKRSLEAGKHVLVEKPAAPIAAEARELGELAKSRNLVLCANQNRRWDSDFLALRRLLNQPSTAPIGLGDLIELEIHIDRFRMELSGSWKEEKVPASGILYDLGIHSIDQVVYLFGRPEKVTAILENVRGVGHPEVDDAFTVILRYPPSGMRKYSLNAIVRGHLLSARDPQLRYVARGTKGTFVKYGVDLQEDQLLETPPKNIYDAYFAKEPEAIWGEVDVLDETGKISKKQWPSIDAGCYTELFKNLAGAIRNGEELKVKWEEVLTVLEIVEAGFQSSKEERTITLS